MTILVHILNIILFIVVGQGIHVPFLINGKSDFAAIVILIFHYNERIIGIKVTFQLFIEIRDECGGAEHAILLDFSFQIVIEKFD